MLFAGDLTLFVCSLLMLVAVIVWNRFFALERCFLHLCSYTHACVFSQPFARATVWRAAQRATATTAVRSPPVVHRSPCSLSISLFSSWFVDSCRDSVCECAAAMNLQCNWCGLPGSASGQATCVPTYGSGGPGCNVALRTTPSQCACKFPSVSLARVLVGASCVLRACSRLGKYCQASPARSRCFCLSAPCVIRCPSLRLLLCSFIFAKLATN